jgi:hypothetical protein
MSEKKLYVKVELFKGPMRVGYFYSTPGDALDAITDGFHLAHNDVYTLTGVEMTQEQFDALVEFEGF